MREENSRRENDAINIEHNTSGFPLQGIMPPPSLSTHGNFNLSSNYKPDSLQTQIAIHLEGDNGIAQYHN